MLLLSQRPPAGSGFIVCSLLYLARRSEKKRGDSGLLQIVHYRLVFGTSFADCIHSIAQMLGDPDDKTFSCYAQAVTSQFSTNLSLGFVVCIAVTLWGTFVHKWPLGDKAFESRLFRRYCFAVFSVAGITTLIPFYGDHYGQSGSWCWIDNSELGEFMRFTTLYGPLWIAICGICIMYHQLIQSLDALLSAGTELEAPDSARCCCVQVCSSIGLIVNGDPSRQGDIHFTSMLRVIRRLCLYPLVLVVCWTIPTVHRLDNVFSQNPAFWLVVAANSSSSINGCFNAMVYGLNASLRAELKACCCDGDQLEDEEIEEVDVQHSVLGEQGTSEEEDKLRRESVGSFSEVSVKTTELYREPSDLKRARTHSPEGARSLDDGEDAMRQNPLYKST